jgi:hypothetical protein
MGSIYSSAQLTIVASAGEDSSYGLPGVSVERAPPQKCEYLRDMKLTQPPDALDYEIRNSAWGTRAWTYQEGYLPKRRLFFTDTRAVYICQTEIQDDMHVESQEVSRPFPGLLQGVIPSTDDNLIPEEVVENMLREYSFRNLSFDSDALDAVVGALNMLEEESPPIRSLYGVPCSNGDVPSAKSYFALH